MHNILVNVCEKFHNDRLRNNRALGNRKADNNKNPQKNSVSSHWGPVSGYKKVILYGYSHPGVVILGRKPQHRIGGDTMECEQLLLRGVTASPPIYCAVTLPLQTMYARMHQPSRRSRRRSGNFEMAVLQVQMRSLQSF